MRARPPPARRAAPRRHPAPPAALPRPARDAVDYLASIRRSPASILTADDGVIAGLLTAQTGAALAELCEAAVAVRDGGRRTTRLATFSPKVFLPVTRLCRDACAYCTFVRAPSPARAAYLSIDDAVAVAAAGAAAGATEALLTLGDEPEAVYPEARAELDALGFASTIDYVCAVADAVREATGLLPHTNVGLVDVGRAAQLRRSAVSQGIMLETTAPVPAHAGCVTKAPAARLAALAAMGAARVPTTTGVLLGIGETVEDRLRSLLTIARASAAHNHHIAEVIIQPFAPKPGTAMSGCAPAPPDAVRWAVAAARLLLGPGTGVQTPPNLAALTHSSDARAEAVRAQMKDWRAALAAGACDFGGISPVTADHVNPEAAWPALDALADAAASEGMLLAPRMPLYPRHAAALDAWVDGTHGPASLAAAVRRAADGDGLARGSRWRPGGGAGGPWLPPAEDDGDSVVLPSRVASGAPTTTTTTTTPLPASAPTHAPRWRVALDDRGALPHTRTPRRRRGLAAVLAAAAAGTHRLTLAEAAAAMAARGDDAAAVVEAADAARAARHGDVATYVLNRNINYTNVCAYACAFCAFSAVAPGGGVADKRAAAGAATEAPYLLSLDDIAAATADAVAAGATEVCLQGGIHAAFTGDTYVNIVKAVKGAAPAVHVHAFSPLEIQHGAATLDVPVPAFLARLKDAGLGSLPGTAAEVLRPGPRRVLCPDKLSGREWLGVISAAHSIGLPTTATLMFGAADGPADWAVHMAALRGLQDRTGGLTEFVPLPFVADAAPGLAAGALRAGPTRREAVAVHAVARLFFDNIDNVQASWPKLGLSMLPTLLRAGANDMGGVLMKESITTAAGGRHGRAVAASDLAAAAEAAGRVPRQRTTLYGEVVVGVGV